MSAQFDALISKAIPRAGERLSKQSDASTFLEAYLEEALVEAVSTSSGRFATSLSGRTRVVIPGWDRPLGGFDIRVVATGESTSEAMLELKVDDVEDTLWDLFKVAPALTVPEPVAGYLVLARRQSRWAKGDCVELFDLTSGPKRWISEAVLGRWQTAWARLLGPHGGSARPLAIPREIETELIGSAPAVGFPDYEIRAIAVRPVSDAGSLALEDG